MATDADRTEARRLLYQFLEIARRDGGWGTDERLIAELETMNGYEIACEAGEVSSNEGALVTDAVFEQLLTLAHVWRRKLGDSLPEDKPGLLTER